MGIQAGLGVMCGIAGLIDTRHRLGPEARLQAAKAMAMALAHRGPDGEGFFTDTVHGIALAHRRLAVIEPSHEADQPMTSPGGRYVMVFNGEIYNYQAIAAELAAASIHFDARSDTRVLLAAIEHWGLDSALERASGMFAFALFDRQRGETHFVRDRFGVKPLSYGTIGTVFLFGSEVSAIEAVATRLDSAPLALDPTALGHYVTYGYVGEGTTIYRDIKKVPPGGIVTRDRNGTLTQRHYWCFETMRRSVSPFQGSDQDYQEALEEHLAEAVRLRLVADVPIGVFLSGGIDSSLVAALMQR